MTRRGAPSLILSSVLLLLLALFPPLPAVATDTATLVRVVDGDTVEIELKGQKEKVRLIGVDTPEKYESDKLHRDAARTGQDEKTIRALGERASDFTKSLMKRGDAMQLEYDQQLDCPCVRHRVSLAETDLEGADSFLLVDLWQITVPRYLSRFTPYSTAGSSR